MCVDMIMTTDMIEVMLWYVSDKIFKEYVSTGDWKIFRSNIVFSKTNAGFKMLVSYNHSLPSLPKLLCAQGCLNWNKR